MHLQLDIAPRRVIANDATASGLLQEADESRDGTPRLPEIPAIQDQFFSPLDVSQSRSGVISLF
jgi:hypothetical protein